MKFKIELTWSKIIALVLIVLAFIIDLEADNSGITFMFCIPFVVFLITGKQFIDGKLNTPLGSKE